MNNIKGFNYILALLPLFSITRAAAQTEFNNYFSVYPIGKDPNIRLMSSYSKKETILFEANPSVKFPIYNNFAKSLINGDMHSESWHASFRPQLRMYTEGSLPVKTPSYRILLGTQHLFRLTSTDQDRHEKFFGFSIESGHYSNGQAMSAFSENFRDGSPESENLYRFINSETDLSEILNRRSGNFSTNMTELMLNYRNYALDDDNVPKKMHSINIGHVLFHDRFLGVGRFGGYSDNDIKIYGRHRFTANYSYEHVLKEGKGLRFSFSENVELISGAHESVNPLRSETLLAVYPFKKSKALGFQFSYLYGHDNYNYRFVDSGSQLTLGITFDQFPPFTITNKL